MQDVDVEHGVRFQPSLAGTLQLSRTNAFFLGGGKALMNVYYRVAENMGIDIPYDTEVSELTIKMAELPQSSWLDGARPSRFRPGRSWPPREGSRPISRG